MEVDLDQLLLLRRDGTANSAQNRKPTWKEWLVSEDARKLSSGQLMLVGKVSSDTPASIDLGGLVLASATVAIEMRT